VILEVSNCLCTSTQLCRYQHPFETLLTSLPSMYPEWLLQIPVSCTPPPMKDQEYTLVDTPAALQELADYLCTVKEIAIDLEHSDRCEPSKYCRHSTRSSSRKPGSGGFDVILTHLAPVSLTGCLREWECAMQVVSRVYMLDANIHEIEGFHRGHARTAKFPWRCFGATLRGPLHRQSVTRS
jgi:hypothetical protein